MTFKQILKEFDEKFTYLGRNQIDQQEIILKPYTTPEDIKSFLKQSFIKYLKNECERLEKSKKDVTNGRENGLCMCGESYRECNCVGYNQAISDQITYITNQIKELEA